MRRRRPWEVEDVLTMVLAAFIVGMMALVVWAVENAKPYP